MPSINLDINYLENIKTKRLVAKFGRRAEMVPIRIWLYAAKNPNSNGKLMGYTASEMRMVCGWAGNISPLIDCLINVGFLDRIGDNDYQIHDWENHQGHILAFSERGIIANRKRWDKYKEEKLKNGYSKPIGGANATPL